ncbi:hypothetical protein D9615_005053 [Tricholomella constricta]|uniref:Uncharacterized protein n=1 Tax=Tricholomella constricta TaxID=117010 RepID=A0A8H5HGH3_9AGAR|nr:hypothetical protein D9615_005053 [Tricholomella constricta]
MHIGFWKSSSSHVMRALRRANATGLTGQPSSRTLPSFAISRRAFRVCVPLEPKCSPANRIHLRNISWSPKQPPRPVEMSNDQEDVAKAAILENVMKGRQPTDLMLRCTILDAEGNVKTISGHFKKSDLSSEHGLNARDLRKVDSRVPNLVPTILIRKEAILGRLYTT